MVSHTDSHTNWSACFQSWSSLWYSQLSTQSDNVICQITSPISSNHPMSSCFIQGKTQSPNKSLDDSICTSTPTLPPYYYSGWIYYFPHLLPCFCYTGLANPQIYQLFHPRTISPAVAPAGPIPRPQWIRLNKNCFFWTSLHFVCVNAIRVYSLSPLFHIFTELANFQWGLKITVSLKSHCILFTDFSPSFMFKLFNVLLPQIRTLFNNSRGSLSPRIMYLTHNWYLTKLV